MRVYTTETLVGLRSIQDPRDIWSNGVDKVATQLDLPYSLENLKIDFEEVSLLDGAGKPMSDSEASKRLFDSLRLEGPLRSTDERLWVTLGLEQFWDYSKLRWDIKDSKLEDAQKTFRNHFFCSTSRMRLRDHPIATLWWRREFISRFPLELQLQAEALLFDLNSDFPVQFLGRPNIVSNTNVSTFLIGYFHEYFISKGTKYNRPFVREILKTFDQFGGGVLLGALTKEELGSIVESNYLRILGGLEEE